MWFKKDGFDMLSVVWFGGVRMISIGSDRLKIPYLLFLEIRPRLQAQVRIAGPSWRQRGSANKRLQARKSSSALNPPHGCGNILVESKKE